MMLEEHICTIIDDKHHCTERATHKYQVLEGGRWCYLCFEHWGMTAIARVTDKDALYSTSLTRLDV